jgi:hypothetical protein
MAIVAWMACLRLVFMHVTWSRACRALLAEKIDPLGEFLLVVVSLEQLQPSSTRQLSYPVEHAGRVRHLSMRARTHRPPLLGIVPSLTRDGPSIPAV